MNVEIYVLNRNIFQNKINEKIFSFEYEKIKEIISEK